MDPRLPRLLPAPQSSQSTGGAINAPSQRRTIATTACNRCRAKKVKCDSRRPNCGRCLNSGAECNYVTKEGESRSSALKRRHEDIDKENDQWKELYSCLKHASYAEAYEMFRRMRLCENPFAVLEAVKHERPVSSQSDPGPQTLSQPQLGVSEVIHPPSKVIRTSSS